MPEDPLPPTRPDASRRSRAPLWLQIVAMFLAAGLPVAWLVGRRSTPPPEPSPLLLGPADPRIALSEAPRGLAGGAPPARLPHTVRRDGSHVLSLAPRRAGEGGAPPYRVRVEGPDGGTVYQATYEVALEPEAILLLVMPGGELRPGRYAAVVTDARGVVRSFPFLVPEAPDD